MQLTQLIGIWKLLYVNNSDPSANLNHYGPSTIGRIIITPELYFNAMITDFDQASLPNNTTWNNATAAQRGAVVKTTVTYEGMFSMNVVGNYTYTHVTVDNALNPEWVGTDQVRLASLDESGGKSILTLVPIANGTKSTQSLVWQKLELPALTVL
ncbi:hypothetical protein N431DRAFT_552073 [Stipitochalara longipes BDJ]|nr:hypothetical protein N431DRAFT_552073 [Stipitochalara longipes BDJ]